jgi:hypothetical protein
MARTSPLLLVLLLSMPAFAANVYVAQSGSGNGTSCSSPYSVATLNGGWAGKVAAGDTLYICGQISSQLQVLASGTDATHMITITADTASGGEFARSTWTGQPAPLTIGDMSWIRVTGITFRATSPTTTSSGNAMDVSSCSNCRIDNNKFGPFAAKVGQESCSNNTCDLVGIYVGDSNVAASNFEMDHNEFVQWGQAVDWGWGNGSSNWKFHDNYCHQVGSCIWPAGTNNKAITGLFIYKNEVYDLSEFSEPADNIHCDGLVHAHAAASGIIHDLEIYDNYMHGPTCATGSTSHTTTWIFIENNPPGGGNYIPSPLVYNNLINTAGSSAGVTDGNIFFKYTYNGMAFNNTIKPGGGTGLNLQGVTGQTIQNNIIDQGGSGWAVCVATCEGSGTSGVVADHNDFFASSTEVATGTGGYTTNPLLNTDGTLQAGSPAIDHGVNDSAACPGCATDKNGVSRPQGSGYDMGAYEYTSTAQAPAPPASLVLVVK